MDFPTLILYTQLVMMIVLAVLYVWYMTRHYGLYKNMGIKGPKPTLVLGNFPTMSKEGTTIAERKWYNEYKKDKVFGIFEFSFPVLMICDLDILKEIVIKKFDHFVNRRAFDSINDYPLDHGVMVIKNDHWKHVRNLITPTFSSGKLKKMVGLINSVGNNMVDNLQSKAKAGEELDVKLYAGAYTMDVLGATAFGIDINSQANPNNAFVRGVKESFNPKAWIFMLLCYFPFLCPLLKLVGIRVWPKSLTDFFVQVTDEAIKQRRSETEKSKYVDFLQLMLNAEVGNQDIDKKSDHRDGLKTSLAWSSKGLTTGDIHGAAICFFLAGYDTTATAISFSLYALAINSDVCDKAIEEVDRVLGSDMEVTYDKATELKYLEMCISETLRLYPSVTRFDRTCNKDVEICGIQFKRGMVVAIPVEAIHHDPEYWPDPEEYNPERFTLEAKAKRNPWTYLPFGLGPRNCIGMRLAQLEVRIGVAKILQNFRPTRSAKPEVPMTSAVNKFWMKLEPRKKTQ